MKFQVKRLVFFIISMITITITSCQKGDSAEPFGLTYIYMPQSLSSGGVNLNYLVPSGLDSTTYNYFVDSTNNTLNITLGVSRSGVGVSEAYSVDIKSDPDTIQAAIANGKILAELLPAKAYSIPSKIRTTAEQYAATFYLTVDIQRLKSFTGKKVALAVYISNPSKYKINIEQAETIVIIDVDALNLY